MENRLRCTRCGSMVSELVKAPGPALGTKMVDQLVCRKCQAAHDEHMHQTFWQGADHSDKTACPKCSDGLTRHNVRPVYRRANKDGTWEMTLLCDCCQADYNGACRNAMEKKQGE